MLALCYYVLKKYDKKEISSWTNDFYLIDLLSYVTMKDWTKDFTSWLN